MSKWACLKDTIKGRSEDRDLPDQVIIEDRLVLEIMSDMERREERHTTWMNRFDQWVTKHRRLICICVFGFFLGISLLGVLW